MDRFRFRDIRGSFGRAGGSIRNERARSWRSAEPSQASRRTPDTATRGSQVVLFIQGLLPRR